MARERWLIDGWELTEGSYRDVESRDGLYATPAFVGANVSVANRRGTVWRPKTLGEGRFTLNGWIGGTDRTAFEAAWQTLLRAMVHPERLVKYERYLASGEVREAYGEVTGVLAPQSLGQQAARFAIEVNVPDGVWRGQTQVIDSSSGTLTIGSTIPLTNLGVSTAPHDEAKIELTGPMSSPSIGVQGSLTEYVRYNALIPAGVVLTIDCASWDLTATGGFTPDVGAIVQGGAGSFLTIPPPGPTGAVPVLTFTGTGTTAASKVRALGKVMHLI